MANIVAVDEDGVAITEATRDSTFGYNGAAWQRTAQIFGEHEFNLDSTIEAKSEISRQVLVQSGDGVQDDVLEAHRISLADTLLQQVLSGDGVGNNLSGVASATGIGGSTYVTADRGSSVGFQDGEDNIEDGGGRLSRHELGGW